MKTKPRTEKQNEALRIARVCLGVWDWQGMTEVAAGGETGLNGEFYKGGQFLPTSADTVKGAQTATIKKGAKAEIEPYVWAPAPADDMLSIFDRIQHKARDNRRECQFMKGQGFVGLQLTPTDQLERGVMFDNAHGTMNARGEYTPAEIPLPAGWREFYLSLINKFNAGERWFPLAEDPTHFKNQKAQK